MTEFFQRLVEAFGTNNSAEIARQLNLERQSIYRWRDGKNDPSLDTLHLIAQLTGASLHWLLTGQGPKLADQLQTPHSLSALPLSDNERQLVEQVAQNNNQPFDQAIRTLIIEAFISRGMMRKQIPPTMLVLRQDIKLIAIPLIGSIKPGQPITYFKESTQVLVADVLLSQGYQSFCLEISSDELKDEGFSAGDKLICCDDKRPQDGKVVVVIVDGATTVKRLFCHGDNILLQPSNGNGSGDLYATDRVEIIYTVTGVLRDP